MISHNRTALLRQALDSIEAACRFYAGPLEVEIFLGINGPDRATSAMISELKFERQAPLTTVAISDPLSPAAARNRMLAFAKRPWLFFLDDDAWVGEDFFCILAAALEKFPMAGALGGPNLTPPQSNLFQRASGAALTSRFAAATSRVRYFAGSTCAVPCGDESLILCNLLIRRSALGSLRFPDRFVCNEENWVLQDLRRLGYTLIYDPRLVVWHERRPKLLQFARQVHKYGIGRGQNIRYRPSSTGVQHLIPAFCLLFSLLTLVVLPWFPFLTQVWFGLVIVYLLVWSYSIVQLRLSRLEVTKVCALSGLLFPVIHLSYGAGVLRGLTSRDV